MCGASNDDNGQYCSACGKAKTTKERCSCGAVLKHGDSFCSKCGTRVGVAPIPVRKPESPTPPSHVDTHNVWHDMGDL